jgi:hypothetical protein
MADIDTPSHRMGDVKDDYFFGVILTELMLGLEAGESYVDTSSTVGNGENTFSVLWAIYESGLLLTCLKADLSVPVDQRMRIAEAVIRANAGLPLGGFRLDMDDGALRFVTCHRIFGTLEPYMIKSLFETSLHWTVRFMPLFQLLLRFSDLSPAAVIEEEWAKSKDNVEPC